jgi:hypothetical protein
MIYNHQNEWQSTLHHLTVSPAIFVSSPLNFQAQSFEPSLSHTLAANSQLVFQRAWNSSPGIPSASNVFTSLVRYRSALLLVSNPSISNIPVAKTPVPECQIGYGPVSAAFSTYDTEQLCVRVIDDNKDAFTGTARDDFLNELNHVQITLDHRFNILLENDQYSRLDEYLQKAGYRVKRARLHQTLYQLDLEEFLASLGRTAESPDNTIKGQYRSITISQMTHRDTFITMRGKNHLRNAVYEARTNEPKDLIADMTKDMESKIGPG